MATPPVPQRSPREPVPERGRWPDRWKEECIPIAVKTHDRRIRGGEIKSSNWSGFVVYRRTKETTINRVEAVWTVPAVQTPLSMEPGQWYTCSSWVGIGGAGRPGDESKTMIQVGFDSNVMEEGGRPTRWAGAWYQWVPEEMTKTLPNFDINPGDTLRAVIVMSSGTEADIYLHNMTRREVAFLPVPNPSGIEITGNCAEWIVEKVELDNDPPALASYGAVCFDEARAFTDRDEELELREGEDGERYRITDDGGKTLSETSLLGNHVVRCAYVGPGGRQLPHDEFFSPDDAKALKKIDDELAKSAPSESLGRIREIVQNMRVRHYRSGCSGRSGP